MSGILYEIVYFGLDFIAMLLLLMTLHEIQMPVMWQIECLFLYTMQYTMLELWTT